MASDLRPGKRILVDDDSTKKIDDGVQLVAEIVGKTMGPKGWNVALRLGGISEGKPIVTKDGVFVANHIMVEDPEVDLGAQMAVEASRKTNDAAGDGTTCTVVLLAAMLAEARKRVKVGSNPIRIQEGMEKERDLVVKFLETIRKPIETEEEIYDVALVSCQDKEIARKITDIIQQVGKYGTVSVEAQTGPMHIDLRVDRGMYYDVGYNPALTSLSHASIAGQLQRKGATSKLTWENSNAAVLIFDEPVRTWDDFAHILSACVKAERRDLLIVADLHDEAHIGLLTQIQQGILNCCVISRSRFNGDIGREMLKDLAVYAGATFMAPSEGTLPAKGSTDINIPALVGNCTAVVTRDSLALTGGEGKPEEVQKRISLIEDLLNEGGLQEIEKQRYRERIARFKAGIGTITIFAPTEVQQTSIRTRVDDAVCAVRSANEEGVVAGGGVALLRCYQWLKQIEREKANNDVEEGQEIVRDALLMPVRKIAEVSGETPDVRVKELLEHQWESTMGYNYWTEEMVDLLKAGILDPAKVVRMCVENAVSVAGEVLRIRATIVDMPKEPQEEFVSPKTLAARGSKPQAGR